MTNPSTKKNDSSVGSGVCVASSGYILTNSHVVNGCNKIELYLADGNTTTASIIYEDTVLDLAILQSKKSPRTRAFYIFTVVQPR